MFVFSHCSQRVKLRCSLVPPFGDKEMKSIFEVSHLRSEALFLNTQCKSLIQFIYILTDPL